MITPELVRTVLGRYALPLNGTHGVSHWARVHEIGTRLAPQTGARLEVVQLFALLHDSQRVNEGHDPDHGARAADFAASIRGELPALSDHDFELLRFACTWHTHGMTRGDVTVRTCWDSDRLDLGRVGIRPAPDRLCTEAARDPDTIRWAHARGWERDWPAWLEERWGVARPA